MKQKLNIYLGIGIMLCTATVYGTKINAEEIQTSPVIVAEPLIITDLEEQASMKNEKKDIMEVDVALKENLQFDNKLKQHVSEVSASYGLNPALVMAVIESESSFQPDVHNGSHLGLMQVTAKWHQDRMDKLGCSDLYDPYQNVIVGVDFLAELVNRYNDNLELALMAYNMGPQLAETNYNNGEISSYASRIIKDMEKY